MKPFLKWAGGKYRVLKHIEKVLPKGKRLVEPFLGSGAVFLNTSFESYLLSDSNSDLINLFNQLKNDGPHFIKLTKKYFNDKFNTEESFYEQRALFNKTSDIELRSALFIYLNRHCFNGLCRYNKKGEFNVPYGRYKTPYFPEIEMREFCLKSKNAIFVSKDFRETMNEAVKGDIVYCDPPYVPLSATSNFTDYASGGFDLEDQKDLVDLAVSLKKKKIPVLISNSDTKWTKDHYKSASINYFEVQRFISADSSKRNKAGEILALFK
jgi:DNA adenine methylase